jgi:hypothetical protein
MPDSGELLSERLLDLDRADPEGVNYAAALLIYLVVLYTAIFFLIFVMILRDFSLIGPATFIFSFVIWCVCLIVLRLPWMIKLLSRGWLDLIRTDIDKILGPYLGDNERILAVLNVTDPSKGPWNNGYCVATSHRCIMLKPRTFLHPFAMAKLVPRNYDVQVIDYARPECFHADSGSVMVVPMGVTKGKHFMLFPDKGSNFSTFYEITEIRKEIYGSVLNLDKE